ncbi:SHOCT domain-containing protein [Cesiribacter sp. SM1]|uniref:SHOCT domain-containing protein n=1 Tax=Cesiribacter sp. SM1 TaxID=2861196 RepID=UPI001CD31EB2|nr:SHOCT domain-containing protein [Cesiribacter sp. SM1]
MNDPIFLQHIAQETGSNSTALAVGVGFDLAAAYLKDAEKLESFKKDYRNYVGVSNNMLYAEVDSRLGKALIDACIIRTNLSKITPIYRYDFASGATLRAENGTLRYTSADKRIVKDMLSIEQRNNGDNFDKVINASKSPQPQEIIISPDEKWFVLNTGRIPKGGECNDCLSKSEVYIVQAANGEAIKLDAMDMKDVSTETTSDLIMNTHLKADTLQYSFISTMRGSFYQWNYNMHTLKGRYQTFKYNADAEFVFPEGTPDKSDDEPMDYDFNNNYTRYLNFEKDGQLLYIWWANRKKGSQLYWATQAEIVKPFDKGTKASENPSEVIQNKLTGLVLSRKGNLYFTTASGNIGTIDLKNTALDGNNFDEEISKAELPVGLQTFDFLTKDNFRFDASSYLTYYNLPRLSLSPDEKHLLYTIGNNLYMIDIQHLTSPKKFIMSIEPFGVYFAKENGETTVYFQALNEFEMPVTKKYSFDRLVNAPQTDQKVVRQVSLRSHVKEKTGFSVADEIKKLKALLDEGIITQSEFEKAKMKLLNDSK